jgi:ubiquinone/menaquinone biosynthesis C-methylase UbiE
LENEKHWRRVFQTRAPNEVSWYQPHLELSFQMISRSGVHPDSRLLDVGGGDSTLVDDLVRDGFSDVTVLDIASSAIERAKYRLGNASTKITWIESDILHAPLRNDSYDVWHDRAVFHFFINEKARREYVSRAKSALKSGAHLILATFAADGPERCSGLPTMRYSPQTLAYEVGEYFTLVESQPETHKTPQGKEQHFIYCRFRRR